MPKSDPPLPQPLPDGAVLAEGCGEKICRVFGVLLLGVLRNGFESFWYVL